MKKSWSHKLFLKINKQVGCRPWLDRLMFFCAQWLIYVLVVVVLLWGFFILPDMSSSLLYQFVGLLLTAIIFAEIGSYITALLWRHPRPIIELPDIKLLLPTVQTWKSFPSDHTIISFTIALVVGGFVGFNLFFIFLFLSASLVAVARIYVGVHYPRDILGGIVFAVVFSHLAPIFLENITQPIFSLVKQLFL